jgi:hypothetical protein
VIHPKLGVRLYPLPCLATSNHSLRYFIASLPHSPFPCFSLTPSFATDPINISVTSFLATLPKVLDLKSFRCHTSNTLPGVSHKLLTRNPTKDFYPERPSGAERPLLNLSRFSFLRSMATKDLSPNPAKLVDPRRLPVPSVAEGCGHAWGPGLFFHRRQDHSKPFAITSFAAPPQLTLVESHRSKIMGGRGVLPVCSAERLFPTSLLPYLFHRVRLPLFPRDADYGTRVTPHEPAHL